MCAGTTRTPASAKGSITTVSMKKKQDFDTEAMEKDGVLDKYMTETEKPEYRFTPKKHKD